MDKYGNKWDCAVICKYFDCDKCDAPNDCEFCINRDSETCLSCEHYYEEELKKDESKSDTD